MKYIILSFLSGFLSQHLFSQNVGIGTIAPTTKLEVKNPLKADLKLSSNNFLDTTQLIFSNRNPANQGTDMHITSNRESGLRFSSKSDLPQNNKDTIMQITPTGLVGIRTAVPLFPLDVKGDVNITGQLLANGNSGDEGQFLRSNGNGTMSWASKERFKNFKIFRNDGFSAPIANSTFTIPSGVTEVGVELWGGGGQATCCGSGASGAYIYAVIPVGSFTSFSTSVGAGGGCNTCSLLGSTTSLSVTGSFVLTARGGYNSNYVASQGTFTASGSYLSNISYFGIEGESAKFSDNFYENSPLGYFIFQRYASGGDAPTRPGSGGKSGWKKTNWDGSSPTLTTGFKGSEPGGGGGFPDADGGHGQIIIYW